VPLFKTKLAEHRLSVIDIPPAYLHEVLHAGQDNPDNTLPPPSLRLVITGGEALASQTVALWRASPFQGIRLLNAYGPTETTITSTVYDLAVADSAACFALNTPIGRPLPHEQVYILDSVGQPVPIGVIGELHIGGAGVALGYLNRPELTAEKFVDDPFSAKGKLYKTGDLARWLADGTIEFLGRIDHQVKIRGFRIECGEIESVLTAQATVKNAVVLAKTVNGNAQLMAYVVPADSDQPLDIAVLKNTLQACLPAYMIPAAFVVLAELPISPAGKIDRQALLQHVTWPMPDQGYIAPVTETECKLATIWAELLAVDRIGLNADFFKLGGHSLLAVRLLAAIQHRFGKDLPLATLLQHSTLAALAALLVQPDQPNRTPLVSIQTQGDKPPLFCVHGAGGQVLCYRELAQALGGQQPCYGLTACDEANPDTPVSIGTMATCYIRALQSHQAQGPYYFAGWSLGGVIAYEMARQLSASGETVALLALLDSYTPSQAKQLEQAYAIAHRLERDEDVLLAAFAKDLGVSALPPLSGNNLDERLAQLAGQFSGTGMLSVAKIGQLFTRFKASVQAMDRYVPPAYAGPVTLFCTGENGDQQRGWSEVAADIESVHIAGDHYTLLQGENALALAAQLKKYLAT
jgi:thioesterase domain-containing protein/acyl carrier protein